MDKINILKNKIEVLLDEVDKAKNIIDRDKVSYLENYSKGIRNILRKIEENTLPASNGGVIGTIRGISEYDSLSSIKSLYNAAVDVDNYYSKECQKW